MQTEACTELLRSTEACHAIQAPGSPDGSPGARLGARRDGGRLQQQFYVVSAHLSHGNTAATDSLRGRQAEAIDAGIRAINTQGLPVVFATDANSSQTSKGVDAPHTALLRAGWYNALAAAKTVNGGYNTVNGYQFPQHRSPWGFGSMYDTIMTLHMPGADQFKQILAVSPGPSDHNLVLADLRLPAA